MQRICKECKRPIYNMMSNLCCNTCLEKYTIKRKQLESKLKKDGKEPMEAKLISLTLFNPMENEYE